VSTATTRTPPTLSRALLRRLAACVAGVLLFAQMAIAAYACPGIASASSDRPAATVASSLPMADCDGMGGASGAALDPAAPNLCAEHCKFGQQSDQAATLSVPVVALALLYTVPPMPAQAAAPRPSAASISALVAASPPHAIAHCVYRI
jgi:hypothetical protein